LHVIRVRSSWKQKTPDFIGGGFLNPVYFLRYHPTPFLHWLGYKQEKLRFAGMNEESGFHD